MFEKSEMRFTSGRRGPVKGCCRVTDSLRMIGKEKFNVIILSGFSFRVKNIVREVWKLFKSIPAHRRTRPEAAVR